MLRLTAVFFVWLASTAYALDERRADADTELHLAYLTAWSATDDGDRFFLEKSQRGWYEYRAGHCALVGDECFALMAQERSVELRFLARLTKTNDRTIVPRHDDRRSPKQR
jgi:uncharacterized protein YecT (DUF1311 family)